MTPKPSTRNVTTRLTGTLALWMRGQLVLFRSEERTIFGIAPSDAAVKRDDSEAEHQERHHQVDGNVGTLDARPTGTIQIGRTHNIWDSAERCRCKAR